MLRPCCASSATKAKNRFPEVAGTPSTDVLPYPQFGIWFLSSNELEHFSAMSLARAQANLTSDRKRRSLAAGCRSVALWHHV